jgi:hypothetical protein
LDLTTFLSYYHGLQTNEPGVPVFFAGPAGPYFLLPTLFDDKLVRAIMAARFSPTGT